MKPPSRAGATRGGVGVAFTPKGGCPLKQVVADISDAVAQGCEVAFTPKGGCPLKLSELG